MNVLGKIEGGKIVFIALDSELPLTERQNHDWRVIGQAQESDFAAVVSGTWLGKTLFDENGIANYKLSDGKAVERTEKEKQEELAARPSPLPSRDERLDALERAMLAMMMGGMPSV
mgnify:CR=1 FL=1